MTTAASKTRAVYAREVVASASRQTKHLTPKPIKPKSLAQTALLIVQFKKKPSAALAYHEVANRETFHFLLGLSLIVGGVVAGLLLGGWLGFGVGALIVLLGYYFLGLGIGGEHAWTEIFQEFFNL
jgi:hypothetical protein